MTKPKNKAKRRAYPAKYREERRTLITKTKPWQKATGPKTDAGKAKSAQNALKHGLRSETVMMLRALLKAQRQNLCKAT